MLTIRPGQWCRQTIPQARVSNTIQKPHFAQEMVHPGSRSILHSPLCVASHPTCHIPGKLFLHHSIPHMNLNWFFNFGDKGQFAVKESSVQVRELMRH